MQRWGVIAAILIGWTSFAVAQETTGTLIGRVIHSQQLAVPGVSVTVTGAQGTQEITTDAEGRFRVPFLTPGTYAIRAALSGFTTVERADVIIRLGQTVDLTLALQIAGVTQAVEVRGTTPVVDQTSTTTGSNLSAELLQSIPVGRRLSDAVYLAPG